MALIPSRGRSPSQTVSLEFPRNAGDIPLARQPGQSGWGAIVLRIAWCFASSLAAWIGVYPFTAPLASPEMKSRCIT
ncbi:MAG TPA: hypothetical protein PLD59_07365, partial [Tepidisphaeraceae bacterium]|nr:hypothetical protein [Tepidisphaeraceae bacterium]